MSKKIITLLLLFIVACTNNNSIIDGTDRGTTVTYADLNDGTDKYVTSSIEKTEVHITKPLLNENIVEERKVREEVYEVPKTSKSLNFLYPVKEINVVKNFKESNFGGVEFSTVTNKEIYAIGPGMVIFSGVKASLGNSIFVYHNDGYISIYTNLDKLNYKKGDYIKDTDSVIGISSELLKFELRKRTTEGVVPLDPQEYLKERA